MLKKIASLFLIKTRFEAYAVIYAIAVGATARGSIYLETYPGFAGYLLAACCTGAVFLGGAKILDATDRKRREGEERRRLADRRSAA